MIVIEVWSCVMTLAGMVDCSRSLVLCNDVSRYVCNRSLIVIEVWSCVMTLAGMFDCNRSLVLCNDVSRYG